MNNSDKLQEFLKINQKSIIQSLVKERIKTQIVSNSDEDLNYCAQQIQQGKLVAFPTETVYGLGANALDEEAVLKIYQTKNRPLSDPVIVHVVSQQQALELVEISSETKKLFSQLADLYWPGPLTMIMKANDKISPKITADTGFVGIRHPNNETAQKLIKFSQRPIVAPSANVFCHVSPTSPVHVFNDLYDKDIVIIDDSKTQFGVESTVIKLINGDEIQILRNGSISAQHLQNSLKQYNITIYQKNQFTKENEHQIAPGQFIKHYAPFIETFLLKKIQSQEGLVQTEISLQYCALIDFDNVNLELKQMVKYYLSFNQSKDLKEVMQNLYEKLRQAENLENISTILITNLQQSDYEQYQNFDYSETINDKIIRCTQGNILYYNNEYQIFK